MALFENWDMYEQALEDSATAAGTLNQQQDIYMETTAAHLQQVRTAAEGVYNSLLDADSINDVADAATKVLQVIEKIVDGMGGLKGILSQVAPLMGMLFSKQIAQAMNQTYNNMFVAPRYNKQVIETGFASLQSVRDKIDPQLRKNAGVDDLLNNKESYFRNAPYLTQESLEQSRQILQNYTNDLVTINVKLQEIQTSTTKWNKTQTDNTLKIDLNNKSLKEQQQEIERAKKEYEQFSAAIKKNIDSLKAWESAKWGNSSMQAPLDKLTGQIDFSAIDTKSSKLGGTESAYLHGSVQKKADDFIKEFSYYIQTGNYSPLKAAAAEFKKNVISKLQGKDAGSEAGKRLVEAYVNKINTQLASKTIDAVPLFKSLTDKGQFTEQIDQIKQKMTSMLNDIVLRGGDAKNLLPSLKEEFLKLAEAAGMSAEEGKAAFEEFTESISGVVIETKRAENALEKLKNFNFEAALTGISQGITSFMILTSSAASAAQALEQGNFAAGLTSIGMAATGAAQGIKLLTTALGFSNIAAAAITIIIGILGVAYGDLTSEIEKESQKAKENAEESSKLYEQKKEEAKNLESLVSEYKNLYKTYEDGETSLEEVRKKTHDLLVEYGELNTAVQALTASEAELNDIMSNMELKQQKEVVDTAKKNLDAAKENAETNIGADVIEKLFHKEGDAYHLKVGGRVIKQGGTAAFQNDLREIGFTPTMDSQGTSFNISSRELSDPENIKSLIAWLEDASNKSKKYYKDIEKIYADNKEYLDAIISAVDNSIEESAKLFALRMGDSFEDFSDFSTDRSAFIRYMENLGLSEEEAEEYVHNYFLKLSDTVAMESRAFLLKLTKDPAVKETIEGLTDEEVLSLYSSYSQGLTDLSVEGIKKQQASYNITSQAISDNSGANAAKRLIESSYQNEEDASTLFAQTSFKEYIEKEESSIQTIEDFEKASFEERKNLVDGYFSYTTKRAELNKNENISLMEEEIDKLREIESQGSFEKIEKEESSLRHILEGKLTDSEIDDLIKRIEDEGLSEKVLSDLSVFEEENGSNPVLAYAESYVKAIEDFEKAKGAAKDIDRLELAISSLEKTSEGRDFSSYMTQFQNIISGESIESLREQQKILQAAEEEYNKDGKISPETWAKLKTDISPAYEELFMKDGELSFNTSGIANLVTDTILSTAEDTLDKINKDLDKKIQEKRDQIEKNSQLRFGIDYHNKDEHNKVLADLNEELADLEEQQKSVNQDFVIFKDILLDTSSEIKRIDLSDYDKNVVTIRAAREEQEKYGQISRSTMESLFSLPAEFQDAFSVINGQLVVQENEIEKIAEKRKEAYQEYLAQQAIEQGLIRNSINLLSLQEIEEEKLRRSRAINSASDYQDYQDWLDSIKPFQDALRASDEIFNASPNLEDTSKTVTYTKAVEWEDTENNYNYIDTLIKDKDKEITELEKRAENATGPALLSIYEEINTKQKERIELQKQSNSLEEESLKNKRQEAQEIASQYGVTLATDKKGRFTGDSVQTAVDVLNKAGSAQTDVVNELQRRVDEGDESAKQPLEEAKEKLSEIQAQSRSLLSLISDVSSSVDSIDDGLENIAESEEILFKNNISKQWVTFDSIVEESSKDVDKLNKSIERLRSDSENLSLSDKIEIEEEVFEKEQEKLKEYENQVTALKNTLSKDDLGKMLSEAGVDIDSLDIESLESFDNAIDQIDDKLKELKDNNADGKNNSLIEVWEDIRKKIESARDSAEKYKEIMDDIAVSSEKVKAAEDKIETSKVDQRVKELNRELSKLKKAQSDLTGQALVNNLRQQLAVQEKIVAQEEKKLAILKKQMQERIKDFQMALAKAGIEAQIVLNEDASLANYYEMVAAIESAVGLRRDERDALLSNLEALNSQGAEVASQFDTVQSAKDSASDAAKAIKDAMAKELSNNFNAKVDVEVNIEEAWRNLHKLRAELEGLRDDDYLGNLNLQFKQLQEYIKTNPNSTLPGGSIQILTDHVNDIMAEIRTMQGGGTSKIYGTDQSAAFSDLEKYRDQLGSNAQAAMDNIKQMKETYLSAIDAIISANSQLLSSLNQIVSALGTLSNSVKLAYGDKAYDRLNGYLERIISTNLAVANTARSQADLYASKFAEAVAKGNKDAAQKWMSAFQDAASSSYGYFETALNSINEKFENTINSITERVKKAQDELSGTSLQYSWMNELQEGEDKAFYNYTNSLYQINALNQKINDSLAEMTDTAASEQLLKVQQEINERLNERLNTTKEISKYEIERANKLYELTLKQMALDEAKENKSKMRLRRDAAGNYRYEYVADEEETKKAEAEVAKAENELYNLARDNVKETGNTIDSLQTKFTSLMESIFKDDSLTTEEKSGKANSLWEEYFGADGLITKLRGDLSQSLEDMQTYSKGGDEGFIDLYKDKLDTSGDFSQEDIEESVAASAERESEAASIQSMLESYIESDIGIQQTMADYLASEVDNMLNQLAQMEKVLEELEGVEDLLQQLIDAALNAYEESLLMREQEISALDFGNADAGSSTGTVPAVDYGGTVDYWMKDGIAYYDESLYGDRGRSKIEAMEGISTIQDISTLGSYDKDSRNAKKDPRAFGYSHRSTDLGAYDRTKKKEEEASEVSKEEIRAANAAQMEEEEKKAHERAVNIANGIFDKMTAAAEQGGAQASIAQGVAGIIQLLADRQQILKQLVEIDATFDGKTRADEIAAAFEKLYNKAATEMTDNK